MQEMKKRACHDEDEFGGNLEGFHEDHRRWSWRSMGQGSLVCLLSFLTQIMLISADTNFQDAAALSSLATNWDKAPSNWNGPDPCGSRWIGITCNNSRVISILLSSMMLSGTLSGDIQSLTELQALDLSYNKDLTGPLPPSIGSLSKLVNLILVGCSFSGNIPPEIGLLNQLVFLSLNSNHFSGNIPDTIGTLSNLYWLDLADNRLSGTIPISSGSRPGLDMLTHTKHFHFGMNQLSGGIPSQLFNSDMKLIHLLLDNNDLSGNIPPTLGLVKTLEIVRLDRNALTGPVPSNLNSLTRIAELHLSNNGLSGPLPNLTGMNALSYLDLSNNSFDASDVPPWFSTLPSLTTLYLEFLQIGGQIPTDLFSFPPLQTAKLRNNNFNGTLNIGNDYSSQLEFVDLQNNQIDSIIIGGGYSQKLILEGNPICHKKGTDASLCTALKVSTPYSTPAQNCVVIPCPSDENLSPNCNCAYPYSGTLYFRAPSFSNLENITYYHILEEALLSFFKKQQLPVESVSLHNPFQDSHNYLEITLQVFPAGKNRFEQLDVSSIGFILSNQSFKPPGIFGPYYFIALRYDAFSVNGSGSKSSKLPMIIGVSAGVVVLAMLVISVAVFTVWKKKKIAKVVERSEPFESWGPSKSSGSVPQLKGARWFSFKELQKCTSNFSESSEIGAGSYGKVYKGTLDDGLLVAVKRAQQGSMNGGVEFKTEIELLSRVHHKNLVSLLGFCYEQGEQMLVYEYFANGTLQESLFGKSGIRLDWRRRLRVALGSARGLSYLHELANPPIIHRDIKSSNILLDDKLNAKVSDFGLSRLLQDDEKGHVTTQVKGTMGYLDPEYYMTQQLTEKSDVYSFGVLLLELITARRPITKGKYIVREVRIVVDKMKDLYGLHELLDPALGLGTTLGGFKKFVDLAMKCVEESGFNRPTMSEVVKEIESILLLAGLNPKGETSSTSISCEEKRQGRSHHPYSNNDSFDNSFGQLSSTIEPK